ncbi:MAG: O-methyltransferase, partial [Acidimicrobiales bacterium]
MTRPSVDPGDLIEYVLAHSTPPDEVQRALVTATEEVAGDASVMRIGHDQAVFMALLTAAIAPRLAVEVGTFTGYSALAIAKALPEGARLLCCDVSEEWTAVARSHWERAGVAHRIDLRIGPAIDTLRALPGGHEVDLAFIDADKTGYQDYYDELLPRLSDRG